MKLRRFWVIVAGLLPLPLRAETMASAVSLPDVVVTAQKTEQAIEQVAGSVSALDGELAEQSGAIGFKDLQSYVGNVVIALDPIGGEFYVRGFGTLSTNTAFEPSVATMIDGVYYGRSVFLSAFFFDIERMEVLRGPQGALFGKNSTAGVFNLETADPEPDSSAGAELFRGDDRYAVRPTLNLALGEGWSLRLAGAYSAADGELYNTALARRELNTREKSARLRLRYAPSADWSAELGAFNSAQGMNYNLFQLVEVSDAMLAVIRSYDPDVEAGRDFRNSANVPARGEAQLDGLNLTIRADLAALAGIDALELTAISAWAEHRQLARDLDADFSGAPVIRDSLIGSSPYMQRSQEIRVAGHHGSLLGWGDGVDFVGGIHVFESRLRANDLFELEDLGAAFAYFSAVYAAQLERQGVPGGPVGGIAGTLGRPLGEILALLDPALGNLPGGRQNAFVSLDQNGHSYGLFGQIEQHATPHWSLIGGLHLGREYKEGDFSSESDSLVIRAVADQNNHHSHRERNENEVSPKLGVKWSPARTSSVYASWSRGYKSGGFNALPLNDSNLEFDAERASSWELGAKTRLLDGSMRLSAALFSTDFERLQLSTFRGASFQILNAGAARSQGAELDVNWLTALPGLALYASLGYADARYTHYPDAPAPADAESESQDLSGRRLAYAPRTTAALVPSYTLPIAGGRATAAFAIDWLYRSDRYLDIDLDPRTYQPATNEINARLTVGAPSRRWLLNVAARNLTQITIFEQILDQPLAPGNFAGIRSDRGRALTSTLLARF
ncbi:TonB-dependent receptor [Fontimonas sp. SYSU GA230001]|uniref:TonB-dependent receptor n=1 Tax=Fontimonas sp. SYSU GA230001 TaxID=3142450 RepID=UPI0032B5F32B